MLFDKGIKTVIIEPNMSVTGGYGVWIKEENKYDRQWVFDGSLQACRIIAAAFVQVGYNCENNGG